MFSRSVLRPLLGRPHKLAAAAASQLAPNMNAVVRAGARAVSHKHKPTPVNVKVSEDGLVRDDFFYARVPEQQLNIMCDYIEPLQIRSFVAQHRPLATLPPVPDLLEGLPGQFPEPVDMCFVPAKLPWNDSAMGYYESNLMPRVVLSHLIPFDAESMMKTATPQTVKKDNAASGNTSSTASAAGLGSGSTAAIAAYDATAPEQSKDISNQEVVHVCTQFMVEPISGEGQLQGALAVYLPQLGQQTNRKTSSATANNSVALAISKALQHVQAQQISSITESEDFEPLVENNATPANADDILEATSVKRKRKLKMNRHKYRKRLKQTRTLRRRLGK